MTATPTSTPMTTPATAPPESALPPDPFDLEELEEEDTPKVGSQEITFAPIREEVSDERKRKNDLHSL